MQIYLCMYKGDRLEPSHVRDISNQCKDEHERIYTHFYRSKCFLYLFFSKQTTLFKPVFLNIIRKFLLALSVYTIYLTKKTITLVYSIPIGFISIQYLFDYLPVMKRKKKGFQWLHQEN